MKNCEAESLLEPSRVSGIVVVETKYIVNVFCIASSYELIEK